MNTQLTERSERKVLCESCKTRPEEPIRATWGSSEMNNPRLLRPKNGLAMTEGFIL